MGQSSCGWPRAARLLGGVSLADGVRPEAAAALAAMHSLGVRTAIVSGDAQATCEAVARGLGVEQVWGDVLPHEKDAAVQRLAAERPGGVRR